MAGTRIRGIGTALPDKTVTNADLEARLDTSDQWIVDRTGIRERRIGESSSALAIDAGRAALAHAGVDGSDVDLVLLCTTTPDQQMPATSARVQHALGVRGGAFDLNAACSGFVYGLVTAHGLLSVGLERVLLIGAETLSRIVDWDDRGTAVLFGDGAGAVLLESTDASRNELLGWDLGADGSLGHILFADIGGTIQMDGREVFRRAVRVMVDSSERAMAHAGVTADEVSLLVPHQANTRIIDAAAERLGIPPDRTVVVLDRTGNTSAASIPLALADAAGAGRLACGDRVLLVGFGAGMTWAAAVLDWQMDTPVPRAPGTAT
jgi:3-oxoacyl-[acyl-carrier-protein] synthase-3